MICDTTIIIICVLIIVSFSFILWWISYPSPSGTQSNTCSYEGIASTSSSTMITPMQSQSQQGISLNSQTNSKNTTAKNANDIKLANLFKAFNAKGSTLPTLANSIQKYFPQGSQLNNLTSQAADIQALESLMNKNTNSSPAPLGQVTSITQDLGNGNLSGNSLQLTSGQIIKGAFPSNPSSVYNNLGLYATSAGDDINIVTNGGNFAIYTDGGNNESVWVSPNGDLNVSNNINIDQNVNVGNTLTAQEVCFSGNTPGSQPVCLTYDAVKNLLNN